MRKSPPNSVAFLLLAFLIQPAFLLAQQEPAPAERVAPPAPSLGPAAVPQSAPAPGRFAGRLPSAVGPSDLERQKKAADVVISVSQETLTEFAEAAMPLTLKGTNVIRLDIPVVGSLEVTIPWVADVSDPQIVIEKGVARFDAAVSLVAAGIMYNDRIRGTFEVVHNPEKNQLQVVVKEAILNLRIKRRRGTTERRVDVANQLSSFDLPIPLPGSQLTIRGQPRRLELSPTIEYQQGAIVVSSPVRIVPRKQTEL